MRKVMKSLSIAMLSLVMIICLFTPVDVQAATNYVISEDGSVQKCGKYYLKRTSKGIYSSKDKKTWKKVVSAKSKKSIGYGFTSDGTYIYYADNNTSKKRGTIYRIKVTGKSKKKIYYAKHMVNVCYYYGGYVVYGSDIYGTGYADSYYSYRISKGKYTRMCYGDDRSDDVASGSEPMFAVKGKMWFMSRDDEDYFLEKCDITTCKWSNSIYLGDVDGDADIYPCFYETSKTFYYVIKSDSKSICEDYVGSYYAQVFALSKTTGKTTTKTDKLYTEYGCGYDEDDEWQDVGGIIAFDSSHITYCDYIDFDFYDGTAIGKTHDVLEFHTFYKTAKW